MRAASLFVVLAALTFSALADSAAAADKPARSGSLFSAILCGETPLGAAWTRLLPEARTRFPRLKFTRVEDLHVTVVYIGPTWKADTLDQLRPLALTGPTESTLCSPEVVALGATRDVVAVELHTTSTTWHAAVAAAKTELNRLRLKSPDRYDAQFRPHVTLAQATHRPPDAADAAELNAFSQWLQTEMARDPQSFKIELGPATPVRLLLAGLARGPDAPDYLPLEDFLPRIPGK